MRALIFLFTDCCSTFLTLAVRRECHRRAWSKHSAQAVFLHQILPAWASDT